MSKDQKKTITVPVETVENLVEFFEWELFTLDFWDCNTIFPFNMISRFSAENLYLLRKLLQEQKTLKKLKNK